MRRSLEVESLNLSRAEARGICQVWGMQGGGGWWLAAAHEVARLVEARSMNHCKAAYTGHAKKFMLLRGTQIWYLGYWYQAASSCST
jgi:hypothetical protein